jgi:hypothetical protein
MQCPVCGMNYGVSHNCSGDAPILPAEGAAAVPEGIAPIYYLRLAFGIARWDGLAIRRASCDPHALPYGVVFSMISAAIIFLVTALPGMLARQGATAGTIFWGLFLGLVFVWVYMGAIAFIQMGLCHLIARWFLGATGTFFGIIRPLLLGWFVNGLIIIPVVGALASAIAWTAVLMMVFEEVDGIGRLGAFLISAGINAIFLALLYLLPH